MFWFLLIALVVVVAAVTLAVLGGSEDGVLSEAPPQYLVDPLPADRPLGRADVEALRLPTAVRGYRMAEVDDALSRLGAELAERDARIADLERSLAGVQATAASGPGLFDKGYPTQSAAVVAEPAAEPEAPAPADASWTAPDDPAGADWTAPEEPGGVRSDTNGENDEADDEFNPWRPPSESAGGPDSPEGPRH
ncbi:DivIVA domain-containing protein [Streptomyces indicus]|uniref:DivIVA domain-containing protein n=1 Tax=Streptomyces indicus TaxID=417292 RepID=A0A1G9FXE7_9ACTN|nr:DivIVA domain-containing protein [Streptomyces indicus]